MQFELQAKMTYLRKNKFMLSLRYNIVFNIVKESQTRPYRLSVRNKKKKGVQIKN
jgi:hypothetical protein